MNTKIFPNSEDELVEFLLEGESPFGELIMSEHICEWVCENIGWITKYVTIEYVELNYSDAIFFLLSFPDGWGLRQIRVTQYSHGWRGVLYKVLNSD